MKSLRKLFFVLIAAGVLYGTLAVTSQRILLWRLEGSEIQISGQNLTPLSLFFVRYKNLTVTYKDLFAVKAKEAVFFFSPFKTLFGVIPLRIQGKSATVSVSDKTFDSFFSGVSLDQVNAKITVFCGKGIAVDFLKLDSEKLRLDAAGKLIRKGKGSSNLSIKLSVSPDLLGRGGRFLTEDLFSRKKTSTASTEPLIFKFKLTGDLTHPNVQLDSDLIALDIAERN